jgi:hypothetical protein
MEGQCKRKPDCSSYALFNDGVKADTRPTWCRMVGCLVNGKDV